MSRLLVAERFNQRHIDPGIFKRNRPGTKRYFRFMLRLGAFRKGGNRRYVEAGLAYEQCMNLCPPAPQVDAWDSRLAREVSIELVHLIRSRIDPFARVDQVVCAGRRVANAMGLAHVPLLSYHEGDDGIKWYALPHPSGLSRWWNYPGNVEAFRAFVHDHGLDLEREDTTR